MRAVVFDRYGPPNVVRLAEVERPVPRDGEILIKVHATTVNRTDCAIRAGAHLVDRLGYSIVTTGNPFKGLRRPAAPILGTEFAGEVEAVGRGVNGFGVGDPVFGINAGKFGAHAEYLGMREDAAVVRKPSSISFEDGASVCDGALLALGCLRKARLRRGQRILIYGASGSIGTAGVQLARHLGAEVTAVCNTANVEVVSSLGPDRVIDYEQEEFLHAGERYEVIFDAVGKLPFGRCRDFLAKGGVYAPTDGWSNLFWGPWTAIVGDAKVRYQIPPHYRKEDVLFLRGLMESGAYRAVIDRRYPLERVVEAMEYVETAQKTGNVVLTL
jgi:NADPH:quinone reductase-like Zn-dependent oxidoreductase